MFELERQILDNIRQSLQPMWEPALEGPKVYYMHCGGTCSGGCKSSCRTECRGGCKNGCTRSCKGRSR